MKYFIALIAILCSYAAIANIVEYHKVYTTIPVISAMDTQIQKEWSKFDTGILHCSGENAYVYVSQDGIHVKDISFKDGVSVISDTKSTQMSSNRDSLNVSYEKDGKIKELKECVPARVYELKKQKRKIIENLG